jgi:nitrate reductase gamma subunit
MQISSIFNKLSNNKIMQRSVRYNELAQMVDKEKIPLASIYPKIFHYGIIMLILGFFLQLIG